MWAYCVPPHIHLLYSINHLLLYPTKSAYLLLLLFPFSTFHYSLFPWKRQAIVRNILLGYSEQRSRPKARSLCLLGTPQTPAKISSTVSTNIPYYTSILSVSYHNAIPCMYLALATFGRICRTQAPYTQE